MGGKGSGNRGYSNTFKANSPAAVDPDSNARTIEFTKALYKLPDFDRGDVGAMDSRIDEFFSICREHSMRPMVGGLALAMSMSKAELWRIVNDVASGSRLGFTPATIERVKKAVIFIDTNFEQLLMDARNPVPAIFYAKSNLGWREAPSETVVTHRSEKPQLEGGTADQIAGKYLAAVGVEEEEAEYEEP